MDEIFHKVHGFRGAFDVVKVAHEKPHRYGKHGELLISYEETEDAQEVQRRRSSVAGQEADVEKANGYANGEGVDKHEHL